MQNTLKKNVISKEEIYILYIFFIYILSLYIFSLYILYIFFISTKRECIIVFVANFKYLQGVRGNKLVLQWNSLQYIPLKSTCLYIVGHSFLV